jgi:hypothetical protein
MLVSFDWWSYTCTKSKCIFPWFFNIYYNVGTAYDLNGTNTGNLPSGFVSIQGVNSVD